MKQHNLFSEFQFGFVQNRSTTLQLLYAIESWTRAIDEGNVIDVCYLDIKKAFDTVPHKRLLEKLRSYGIKGRIHDWIKNFLADRKQSVQVNETRSQTSDVGSGVPQGSVLEPTLFVIYINDIPESINSSILLYADDSKLFRPLTCTDDVEWIQRDLNELQNWSEKWLLKFHPEKCQMMRIGVRQDGKADYYMDTENSSIKLKWSTCERDLGVHVDSQLKFQKEIQNRIKKGNTIVGLIRRTFTYLDENMMKRLFTSLVRPVLEYANTVWSPYLAKDIRDIESIQRRATKMIPTLKNMSYEDRLKKLKLPTLTYRRHRGDQIETYKILHQKLDINPNVFFNRNTTSRTRGHSLKIEKPRVKTTLRARTFSNRVINDWNSLPEEVADAPSINSFKNRLDHHWRNHQYLHHPY